MESRAKNPGLLGRMVLGGAVATLPFLSGCVPLEIASLYEKSRAASAAHRQADALHRQADAMHNGNAQNFVDPRYSPRWEIFTCTSFDDFDRDGSRNLLGVEQGGDVVDKGKSEFYVGDKVEYVIALYNCQGRKLEFFGQEFRGEEPKKMHELIVKSNSDFYSIPEIDLNEPASWHAYWVLDGSRIGEHRITVREDPARITNNKR